MLDIKFIRENADLVAQSARDKGYDVNIAELLGLDEKRRELQQKTDRVREQRNQIATQTKGGGPTPELIEQGKRIKEELVSLEKDLRETDEAYGALLNKIPNISWPDVPVGANENENVVAKTVGDQPHFDFAPKNHYEISEQRDWIDKTRAAKVTGTRFAYIKGDLVRLWWALQQFAVVELTNEKVIAQLVADNNLNLPSKPFTPVLPPLMIRTDVYDAMDRLEPRDERYKIEGDDLWLQGSAEHVLGSMHFGEIIDESDLPLRYIGFATSFRREAGSYGKDTEGIFRMHQFDKLEMESLTIPEHGFDEHLLMVAIQEYLNQRLGLPYRVIQKCTADIGKPNTRGIDIDTWMPGQGQYRETHTADFMTDYQSRRLGTRARRKDGSIELVTTNDATAFAQRTLIALIENYQNQNGTVRVPEALQAYLGGAETL